MPICKVNNEYCNLCNEFKHKLVKIECTLVTDKELDTTYPTLKVKDIFICHDCIKFCDRLMSQS